MISGIRMHLSLILSVITKAVNTYVHTQPREELPEPGTWSEIMDVESLDLPPLFGDALAGIAGEDDDEDEELSPHLLDDDEEEEDDAILPPNSSRPPSNRVTLWNFGQHTRRSLSGPSDKERAEFLDAPVDPKAMFGSTVTAMRQQCDLRRKEGEAFETCLPRKPTTRPYQPARMIFTPQSKRGYPDYCHRPHPPQHPIAVTSHSQPKPVQGKGKGEAPSFQSPGGQEEAGYLGSSLGYHRATESSS
ncbi:hypothetical protein PO909_015174 [Leuciscus waleckii]